MTEVQLQNNKQSIMTMIGNCRHEKDYEIAFYIPYSAILDKSVFKQVFHLFTVDLEGENADEAEDADSDGVIMRVWDAEEQYWKRTTIELFAAKYKRTLIHSLL